METAKWYRAVDGHADHLVYLDNKADELNKLFSKVKSMIIRGAAGKKVPLGGRVKEGDTLYFVETGADLIVTSRANVKKVIETPKMTIEESVLFLEQYKTELNLSDAQYKRWSEKKYLCLVEIENLEKIEPFKYRRDNNMDDWIITDDINTIKDNL